MQVAVPVSTTRTSTLLTGHKRSSSADTKLIITKKNKASAAANIAPVIQQYTTKLVPKPLLGSISKY